MKAVHLICGVPGAGKTWVAKQLDNFSYLPHDDYTVPTYGHYLATEARKSSKPVLGEAPFRISVLIDQLQCLGVPVVTYYISEPMHVIKKRYEARDGKPWPKQHQTNLMRYEQRDWDNRGTAPEILSILKGAK